MQAIIQPPHPTLHTPPSERVIDASAGVLVVLLHLAVAAVLLHTRTTDQPGAPHTLMVEWIESSTQKPAPPAPPQPPKPMVEPVKTTPKKSVLTSAQTTTAPSELPKPVAEPAKEAAPAVSNPAPTAVASAPAAPALAPGECLTAAPTQMPEPKYPRQSERLGETGIRILDILVDTEGKPKRIEVRPPSRYSRLEQAAIDAVQNGWHFIPAKKNGEAIESWYAQRFNFDPYSTEKNPPPPKPKSSPCK